MPRLSASIGLLSLSLVAACSSIGRERFEPIGDVLTTTPRSNAERGFGEPIQPPAGLNWALSMVGFHGRETDPPRYELELRVVDTLRGSLDLPRCQPIPEGAELVDDSGHRFACARARVPDLSEKEPREGEPSVTHYTMIFDLPADYRFRSVFSMTVHWHLRDIDGGDVLPISSRFRR